MTGLDTKATPLLDQAQAAAEFRKLDVSVRETDYTAGKQNLTAIVIRNTYPISVTLVSVTASHSTLNTSTRSTVYRGATRKLPRPSNTRVRVRIPNPLHSFFPNKYEKPLFELLHNSSSIMEEEPIFINADAGAMITLDEKSHSGREIHVNAKEGAIINFAGAPDEDSSGGSRSVITSMSEIVSEYFWKTKGWLLFIPSRIGIDIEIRYKISNEVRSQVATSSFDIKPPIISILIGGVAGGVIGNLARAFTEPTGIVINLSFAVKLVGSCLLSIMAVIFLSRKSGPQSFITVEDFFGAFVLGSLIGYEGTSFFEKTVINNNDGTSQK